VSAYIYRLIYKLRLARRRGDIIGVIGLENQLRRALAS
jgi:hypothetical protein